MERRKRRWYTRGITWLSLIVIAGAVLSGLFQLAVALAPGYRDVVAVRASTALGQPVQVDGLALRWRWLRPLLELNGVRLLRQGDAASVVEVERIRLGFELGELLRGEWVPGQVEVEGVSLAAEIGVDGRWRLRGRAPGGPTPTFEEIAQELKRFNRLRAERLNLQVHDLRPGGVDFSTHLQRADLRLDTQGFELRAELDATGVAASRLRLRAGMEGDLAQPLSWTGRWTLDANDIAIGPALVRQWPMLGRVQATDAALTAAGDWQQGVLGATQWSLRAQALGLSDEPQSLLREVDLGLHYRPTADGGVVDLVPLRLTGQRGAWPTTTARLEWRKAAGACEWRASSDFLRLDDLAPWLAALSPPPDAEHLAVLRSLKGDLRALESRWLPVVEARPGRYSVHARVEGLAARWPEHVEVQGVSGELTADETSGRLRLQGEPLSFALPRVFAGTQKAGKLTAEAQWQRESAGWRVQIPSLDWALLGSSGHASGELRLPDEGAPRLKLDARFDASDVAALKPLIPLHWGVSLQDWLNRAVVRGRVSNAQLSIDGPLADFPYHKKPTGQWSLKLPLSNARLEYHPDWPGIDQLNAVLRFSGNSLSFEAQRGLINGVAVTEASGSIEDVTVSPLVLDGKTAGEAPYYYSFLRASPLATRLHALLSQSEAEGPVTADVHLQVPLHHEADQTTIVRGTVNLLGDNLRHTALDRPVRNLTGQLHFGGGSGSGGVSSDDLQGRFFEQPVTAHISRNAEGNDVIEAALAVDFDAADGVAAHYVPGWLRQQLRGHSDWRVSIPLAGPGSGEVRLTSPLVGTDILLPAPLDKPAQQSLPISLVLSGSESVPLTITGGIAGRVGVAMRFGRGSAAAPISLRRMGLRVGEGAAPALPTQDGWQLNARFGTLSPTAWRPLIDALRSGSEASGNAEELPFLGATLSADTLRVAGYDLTAVQAEAQREYGGIAASVKSEGSSGQIKISSDGSALSGQFTHLQLKAAPKQPATADSTEGPEPTDPLRAPTLDLAVDALRIGSHDFGTLAFATERANSGQRLRRFAMEGGIASIHAEGAWRRVQGVSEASTEFTVTSNDLAGTLDGLGFAPTVSGRNARIEGKLSWPGAARGLDWALGRGTVSLMVEDGALRMLDPGNTSRVLGLFNFYALPRRLTLDFGDVVSKGLGFDQIEGHFQLANGVAHTDDLNVRGPSVRMAVRGNVGLKAQDYDQVVTVTPNTKGITLGALLLGGAASVAVPVLPLLAVIANQVIDKPLSQVTQFTYGVTGSWENPEIKKLEQPPTEEPAKP